MASFAVESEIDMLLKFFYCNCPGFFGDFFKFLETDFEADALSDHDFSVFGYFFVNIFLRRKCRSRSGNIYFTLIEFPLNSRINTLQIVRI